MKKLNRKQKHLSYVRSYLLEIQYKIVNLSIEAESKQEWDDHLRKKIYHNAKLIRKYQRRLKLLKF